MAVDSATDEVEAPEVEFAKYGEPRVAPGEGHWVCGECKFLCNSFEGLERHVYREHLGVTSS
jgi:hypothetical protein